MLVGGGPTGVEVAAELHDMIVEDLKGLYPSLMELVSIKIVAVSDHLLSAYDRQGNGSTQMVVRAVASMKWNLCITCVKVLA